MKRRTFLSAVACAPAVSLAVDRATVPSAPMPHHRRIGIAFGGGSAHGVAHLGVLKALTEKGLAFHVIAGTSAGAIIGVLAAAKFAYREIDQITRRIEWPGVANIAWSRKGLMQHSKLGALIETALGGKTLEQLPITFGAIATDIASGERIILRRGAAGAAVGASSSIPVMFEPVTIDGRQLVDGGLTEPVPVIAAREMGADIVIGVDVAFRPNEDQFRGFTGIAFQTMHIMGNALIKEQLRRADVVIRMDVHHLIGTQNSHDQLVAAGYAAAMRAWPALARLTM